MTGSEQAGERTGRSSYPTLGSGRDERLDLLRGAAVIAMVVDHVGGASFLYAFTGGNRFFTSAAEAFIGISGLVMGIVYRGMIEKSGLGPALVRTMERAATLYLLAVTLTLLFIPASEILHTPWAQGADLWDPTRMIVSILTLHQTYYLVDIPLLYTLLLLAAPLALALLAQGHARVVLAASWLLWAAYQAFPAQVDVPWTIQGNHLFFFGAWQVFFFSGLVCGWHKDELEQKLTAGLRRVALVVSGVGFGLIVAVYLGMDQILSLVGKDVEQASSFELFVLEGLFSKADVRVGRIVATLVVFAFLYLLVTVAWDPIRRVLGGLLLPLGRNALYAYAAHVALAIPVQLAVSAAAGIGLPLGAVSPIAQVCSIAGIWLLINGRVLFVNPSRGAARYLWPATAAACLFFAAPLASVVPQAAPVQAAAENHTLEARKARAFGTPAPRGAPISTTSPATPQPVPTPLAAQGGLTRVESEYVGDIRGTLGASELYSPALDRTMPYFIYLPPGYDNGVGRYPVLYMLHGNSGSNEEWLAYGLIDQADAMVVSGEIRPLIIVLPQGDYSYWVNLVNGPRYGDYLAEDLVDHIKQTYRVLPGGEHRAIGGLSMGGTGALIHAFVNPSTFGVVGAHSPALPEEGWREFLGRGDEFARRDPISLALSEVWLDELAIWIDVGDEDAWLSRCQQLNAALDAWALPHAWHVFPGDHWGPYWSEHIPDYLRFYDAALNQAPTVVGERVAKPGL